MQIAGSKTGAAPEGSATLVCIKYVGTCLVKRAFGLKEAPSGGKYVSNRRKRSC